LVNHCDFHDKEDAGVAGTAGSNAAGEGTDGKGRRNIAI